MQKKKQFNVDSGTKILINMATGQSMINVFI